MLIKKRGVRRVAKHILALGILASLFLVACFSLWQPQPKPSSVLNDGRILSMVGVTDGAEPLFDADSISLRGIYWRTPLRFIPFPKTILTKLGLDAVPWVKPFPPQLSTLSPQLLRKDARTFWLETLGASSPHGNSGSFSIPQDEPISDEIKNKLNVNGVKIEVTSGSSGERLTISGGFMALSARRRNLAWFQISQLAENEDSIILKLQQSDPDGALQAPVTWRVTLP